MPVIRRALIAILLGAACSPAASLAPATTPPGATGSTTAATTQTATPTPTSPSPYSGQCPAGSLPSGRITFTVGNGQANGIGIVNADGSDFRRVVEPKDIAGQPHGGTEGPTWIGAGRILFDSNRMGGPDDWHLFTVDARDDDLIQITKGADGIEYHGDLSPDGTFLAYAKAVADPEVVFVDAGLFVADPDGRHERQLTKVPSGGVDEWPAISPDGKQIAFGRGHLGDNGGLMIVNADGSGLTRVVPTDLEPSRPRWSSDGRRITFSSNGDRFLTESANVWVVNADGTGLRQVTRESGGDLGGQAFYPTWSPDDVYLLFIHHRRGSGTNDLSVVPSAGGAICTLWKGTAAMGAWESDWAPADKAISISH
jgi:Tol biopolymer transport system component